jgi:hypothetical protein
MPIANFAEADPDDLGMRQNKSDSVMHLPRCRVCMNAAAGLGHRKNPTFVTGGLDTPNLQGDPDEQGS